MKFDINEMVKSKEAFRQRLAALPIAEKLRLLDAMRERAVTIREATHRESITAHEEPARYAAQKEKTHE
jgi:hypothetical protein